MFNTYDLRLHENDACVMFNFIMRALRGEPSTIYRKGSQTRSFHFHSDLIEGAVRLRDRVKRNPSTSATPFNEKNIECAHEILVVNGSKANIDSRLGYCKHPIDPGPISPMPSDFAQENPR
jgi:UDP-glucuronate decarboxylase